WETRGVLVCSLTTGGVVPTTPILRQSDARPLKACGEGPLSAVGQAAPRTGRLGGSSHMQKRQLLLLWNGSELYWVITAPAGVAKALVRELARSTFARVNHRLGESLQGQVGQCVGGDVLIDLLH